MNFLQIVNRVRQNVGVSGADLTTVTGLTGESARIANWVNESWLDMQAMRQDWQWLRNAIAFPTVAGQAAYTPAQIGASDFGLWARDSFRNYANPLASLTVASPSVVNLAAHRLVAGDTVTLATTGTLPIGLTAGTAYYVVSPVVDSFQLALTAGGVAINTSGTQTGTHTLTSSNTTAFVGLNSEIFMDYIEYDTWRNNYQYGALRSVATRPISLTIAPSKALELGPIADAGYTIVGDYYKAPTEMEIATDIPALPVKFHLALVYAAMVRYGMFEAATEVVQQGQSEFSKWKARILADQLPEVTTGGSLS
jgi:hypothetical protein